VFCPSAVVWGDVATWATAVFTLAATIGASIAAVAAWRVLSIERQRDAGLAEERRRAQAEKVSAWMDSDVLEVGGPFPINRAGCQLLNVSDQPVSRIGVAVKLPDGTTALVARRQVLPPGGTAVARSEECRAAMSPWITRPGAPATPSTDADRRAARTLEPDWRHRIEEMPVMVVFTDAAGIEWCRDFDGQLRPASPQDRLAVTPATPVDEAPEAAPPATEASQPQESPPPADPPERQPEPATPAEHP
jgi:hypothetical protein